MWRQAREENPIRLFPAKVSILFVPVGRLRLDCTASDSASGRPHGQLSAFIGLGSEPIPHARLGEDVRGREGSGSIFRRRLLTFTRRRWASGS